MALPISITRAVPSDRWRDFAMLGGLVLWLAYTRIYWTLQATHLTFPPCPFYYLTGHPCPFCGGTRSFAYMWRGGPAGGLRLFSPGPPPLPRTLPRAAGAVTGRTWTPRLSGLQWRLLAVGAVSAISISWALKVFVLGN